MILCPDEAKHSFITELLQLAMKHRDVDVKNFCIVRTAKGYDITVEMIRPPQADSPVIIEGEQRGSEAQG